MDSTRFELVTTSMSTKYATTAPTVHGDEKRYGLILPSFCSFVYGRVVVFQYGPIANGLLRKVSINESDLVCLQYA